MFQSGPDLVEYNRSGQSRGHKISFFRVRSGSGQNITGHYGVGVQKTSSRRTLSQTPKSLLDFVPHCMSFIIWCRSGHLLPVNAFCAKWLSSPMKDQDLTLTFCENMYSLDRSSKLIPGTGYINLCETNPVKFTHFLLLLTSQSGLDETGVQCFSYGFWALKRSTVVLFLESWERIIHGYDIY